MKLSHFRFVAGSLVLLMYSQSGLGRIACREVMLPKLTAAQIKILQERHNVDPNYVLVSPDGLSVKIRGTGHETLAPDLSPGAKTVREIEKFDVTIVATGPAAMMAAIRAARAGLKVRMLERNPSEKVGGLANGSNVNGVEAGSAAAYSAGPGNKWEYKDFQTIGLGNYKQLFSIKGDIDAYKWRGKIYKEPFHEHSLKELPVSFLLYKFAQERLIKMGGSDLGEALGKKLDDIDMATLMRSMPTLMKEWTKDKKHISKKYRDEYTEILKKLEHDALVDKKDPMIEVIKFLNLYGRSALGGETHQISARQFLDFYESEMGMRYTGQMGTGTVMAYMMKTLQPYIKSGRVEIVSSAPVVKVENKGDESVITTYLKDGQYIEVESKYAVYGASVDKANKIIPEIAKKDPKKAAAIARMDMSDYLVVVVRVKGERLPEAYDIWVDENGNLVAPTDYINGRWQAGRPDDKGVISIYMPFTDSQPNRFTKENTLRLTDLAIKHMKKHFGEDIEVELAEANPYPNSIHKVFPGFGKIMPDLARPLGRIFFANNTIGSPELESAMHAGTKAAYEIIEKLTGKKMNREPQSVKSLRQAM
ncbi:MAG: hypothetical protein AB7O96_15750 [Pseudobdellovibrionaceae bacterium]